MPYTIKAECPCCPKTADGLDEIEEKFGWRVVNNRKIPQSYCRACRAAKCNKDEPCKVIKLS